MIANRYNLLKDKCKKMETQESYENILATIVSTIFTYNHSGISDIDFTIFELSLISTGKVAVWKKEDNLVVTPCELVGTPDIYGRGVDCICYYVGGTKRFEKWKDNKDIVIVFNNEMGDSDYTIDRFATYLTEVDISEMACLKNCRYSSLIPVKDSKTKLAVESALQNNEIGTPQSFVSKNILDENDELKVLHLTDVKDSDKLQYLSHFRDDLLRQFFTLYGMSTNSTAKMAQQTVAEISDANNSSNILPFNMKKWREIGIKEINKTFGLDWSVDFSECWKKQIYQEEDSNNEKNVTAAN